MWQRLLVISSIFLIGCSSTEKIPPPSPIPCSILSLESRAGMKAGEAESVTDMFSSALQNSGRFTVVERNKLNAVLQEQGFQAAQNGEDAVKAGKILSVRKMFSGSIGMLGEKYIVNLKMIDVETGKIKSMPTEDFTGTIDDLLLKGVRGIVYKLIQ